MTDGSRRSHVIRRSRILEALAGDTGTPIRLLCAPVGSGVTTALREYAGARNDIAYLSAGGPDAAAELAARLAACTAVREVLIDDADRLTREAFDAVLAFALRSRAPRLVLAGHARARLRVHTLVASGDAELLDADALTFNATETMQLATALGVPARYEDVVEVLHRTDGWAVAVAWILRDAARRHGSLCGAFDIWADANGHLLREFLESAIGEASNEMPAFQRVCTSSTYHDLQPELTRLDVVGYPVVRTRQGLRPYSVFTRIASQPHERGDAEADDGLTLTLILLGQFSARIGDHEVAFVRRRDRNVLIYLALSPAGKVARAELAAMFWPDVPSSISSQGIRTTLSRLRHALATASGTDADRYLRAGTTVALDLDRVSVDARRFAGHVAQGRLAEERGDPTDARNHFLVAQRFRGDDLLRSEAIEAPFEPLLERYAELTRCVAERLAALDAPGVRHLRRSTDRMTLRLHGTPA